jgi:hypothetical protein
MAFHDLEYVGFPERLGDEIVGAMFHHFQTIRFEGAGGQGDDDGILSYGK